MEEKQVEPRLFMPTLDMATYTPSIEELFTWQELAAQAIAEKANEQHAAIQNRVDQQSV